MMMLMMLMSGLRLDDGPHPPHCRRQSPLLRLHLGHQVSHHHHHHHHHHHNPQVHLRPQQPPGEHPARAEEEQLHLQLPGARRPLQVARQHSN